LQAPWIADEANLHAACAGDKAVYIWGGSQQCGTLEDFLFPMFAKNQPERIEKAASAVDRIFRWDTDSDNFATAVAEAAKRKKSIITVAGQREKPGMSMNVILDQADLIKKASFLADGNVVRFANFLDKFMNK
jgi:hypothetical protein